MINAADLNRILIIPLLLSASAQAETTASGQLRTTASVAETHDSTVKGIGFFGRMSLKTKTSSGAGGEAAYELLLFARPDDETGAGDDQQPLNAWRVTDTGNPVRRWNDDEGSAELRQNLDRLLLFFSAGPVDATAGRQAVSFGPGKFANPTDIFVPWRYDDTIRIDRSGVDAFRVKTSIGGFRVLDSGIVAGKDGKPENSAAFVRYADNFSGTDTGLMAVRFQDNTLTGIDVQGAVADAGVWLEAAHVRFVRKNTVRPDGTETSPQLNRLAAGSDFIFASGAYLAGEVILNDQGYREKSAAALTDPRFAQGRIALSGKAYAGTIFTYPVQPLLTAGTQALWNATDRSLLLQPSATWSLSDGSELVTGLSGGTGALTDEFAAGRRQLWCSIAAYF